MPWGWGASEGIASWGDCAYGVATCGQLVRPQARDLLRSSSTVVNRGPAAWLFAPLADQLGRALRAPVSDAPGRANYVLGWEEDLETLPASTFIPKEAIRIANDKRALERAFSVRDVARPETCLVDALDDLRAFARDAASWCLKYPTGVGGYGHRHVDDHLDARQLEEWPRPFVVQRFVSLRRPQVFRVYAVEGRSMGFNVRRFRTGDVASEWVSHARGARYASCGPVPPVAEGVAREALAAARLDTSFGCVDLLRSDDERWLALEVGTDGVFSHIDRDVDGTVDLVRLHRAIAGAFDRFAERCVASPAS